MKQTAVTHGYFATDSGLLNPEKSRFCFTLLDQSLSSYAKPMSCPISHESIWGMRHNYSESLTKVMRQKTVHFTSIRSPAHRAATNIGLLRFMRSETLAQFAESVTGERLERDNGVQAILYEHGDYVGPHNDHHPEHAHLRDGYVDVHISFTNEHVDSQILICQNPDGHLNVPHSAIHNGLIAVYRLPFWHYVTPLIGKQGHEAMARRWVIMSSYTISKQRTSPPAATQSTKKK